VAHSSHTHTRIHSKEELVDNNKEGGVEKHRLLGEVAW
jgi:hypothetical protein